MTVESGDVLSLWAFEWIFTFFLLSNLLALWKKRNPNQRIKAKPFQKMTWNQMCRIVADECGSRLWQRAGSVSSLMFHQCVLNQTHHDSQQLFLRFLRCWCTKQRLMYSVFHSLYVPPCLHPSVSPCWANPSWPNPSAEKAYIGAVLLRAICHPLPWQCQPRRALSPTVVSCQQTDKDVWII